MSAVRGVNDESCSTKGSMMADHPFTGRSAARRCMSSTLTMALLLAISLLCLEGTTETAQAQVSSDGDMMPITIVVDGGRSGPSVIHGRGTVWMLRTADEPLATMVVTGSSPGGELSPETEYITFAPEFARHIEALGDDDPLYFHRIGAKGAELPALPAKGVTSAEIARTFDVEPRPTWLVAAPERGVRLYHLESRSAIDGRRVDHFLRLTLRKSAPPLLDWYVDLTRSERTLLDAVPSKQEAHWAVDPGGFDLGRLTPVAEAVAHHMIPVVRD